jgi:hypothetical protein
VRRSEDRDTGNHVGIGVGAAPCRNVTSDDARVAISLMARRSLLAWLRAAFPIVAQLESYRSEWFLKEVTAGLAIAAVALPIGVAYPAIAGLPPIVGLYASILRLVGYGIFGSSRQLIVGPDAATLTILAASLSQVPMTGSEQQRAVVSTSVSSLKTTAASSTEGNSR